ncbi:MAG: sel1 repeat family protein [Candidatus Methanomethylophilaceae archaeon]|nr:sel1 repeat family protein [Candidatus Methanomethylophilaceae archaeon]
MGFFDNTQKNSSKQPSNHTDRRPEQPTEQDSKQLPPVKFNQDIIRKAKAGDAAAQCKLGVKYKIDGDILTELQTMIVADRKSENDFKEAYGLNMGPEQAYSAAFELLSRSAEQQYGPAEYYLALMYQDGLGVEKSEKKYDELISLSELHTVMTFDTDSGNKPLKQLTSDQIESMFSKGMDGDAQALYDLAWGYLQKNPVYGEKVFFAGMQDYYEWGRFQNPFDDSDDYTWMVKNDHDHESAVASNFIDSAKYLLRKASELGHKKAEEDYDILTTMKRPSSIRDRNAWLSANANRMSPAVESEIARWLDPAECINLLQHAADRGYSNAYIILAEKFESGNMDVLIEAPDYPYMMSDRAYFDDVRREKYEEYLKKAIAKNNSEAMVVLGLHYPHDMGLKDKHEKESFELFMNAAKNGYPRGMNLVAECYQYGLGVKKSDDEAIKWYTKAAEAGDTNSGDKLFIDYGIRIKTKDQKEDNGFDDGF